MSIRPVSDLVLDVARAADPARVATAQAKLAASAGVPFDAALAGVPAGASGGDPTTAWRAAAAATPGAAGPARGKAYAGLEQLVLAKMVETMLPKASAETGTAGPVWRGMLADAIARSVVAGGGVGIARELESRSRAHG